MWSRARSYVNSAQIKFKTCSHDRVSLKMSCAMELVSGRCHTIILCSIKLKTLERKIIYTKMNVQRGNAQQESRRECKFLVAAWERYVSTLWLGSEKSTACVLCGLLLYNSLNKNFVVFATHQQK